MGPSNSLPSCPSLLFSREAIALDDLVWETLEFSSSYLWHIHFSTSYAQPAGWKLAGEKESPKQLRWSLQANRKAKANVGKSLLRSSANPHFAGR